MFWKLIGRKYIQNTPKTLHFPVGILGDFENRYVTYDDNGNVVSGEKTLSKAINKCKKDNLYLTKIINNL